MDVKITLPKSIGKLDQLSHNVRRALRQSFYDIGKDLIATSSKNILKKKTGRVYPYKRIFIKASRPGESWANRSGRARRSIDFKVQGSFQMTYFSKAVKYVKYLEYGTERMYARPALKISIKENYSNMITTINNNIQKYLI